MDFLPALALMLVGLVSTILSGVGVATFVNRARERRPMKRHVAQAKEEQPLEALEREHLDRRVLVAGRLGFLEEDGVPRAALARFGRELVRTGGYREAPEERWLLGREGARSTITDAHAPPKVPPMWRMLRRRFAFTDLGGWDRLLGAGAALVVAAGFGYLATGSWLAPRGEGPTRRKTRHPERDSLYVPQRIGIGWTTAESKRS